MTDTPTDALGRPNNGRPFALGHAAFSHPDAACRGQSVDLFYPPNPADVGSEASATMAAAAKAICGRCPAADACLDYALANRERYGIWGGYTEKERRRVAQQRRINAGAAKRCLACGLVKPLAEFPENRPGVPKSRCRPCQLDYERPFNAAYRARKKAERQSA